MIVIFISNFIILFTGMGLFPILPLYSAQFGATSSMIGLYLGIIYTAIALGSMLTGWLAERLPRQAIFVIGSALGTPALILLGQASEFWQVVLMTAIVWFSGGIGLALISVFTGLLSNGKNRGKSFSLMFLASPLGALLGGAAVSQLIAWQGYPLMFSILGIVWSGLPVIGIFGLKNLRLSKSKDQAQKPDSSKPQLNRQYFLLLLVSLLSATSISASRIGTSFAMKSLEFSPQSIASTATISGLLTIPMILLVGAVSDRVERRRFLLLSNLLAAGAALVLSSASELWQFWSAATLILVVMGINSGITPALATEILAPKALNRGLAWLNTAGQLASVLSFTGSGYLMQRLGLPAIYLMAAILPVAAFALIGMLSLPGLSLRPQASQNQEAAAPVPQACL